MEQGPQRQFERTILLPEIRDRGDAEDRRWSDRQHLVRHRCGRYSLRHRICHFETRRARRDARRGVRCRCHWSASECGAAWIDQHSDDRSRRE